MSDIDEQFYNNIRDKNIVFNPNTHPLPPSELLKVCNQVREIGGAETLDALLPGIKSTPHSCLIAKNLNFDCSVWPRGSDWGMKIQGSDSIRIGEKIAKTLGWKISNTNDMYIDQNLNSITLILPPELGASAWAFDNGLYGTDLDEKVTPFMSSIITQDIVNEPIS